MRHWEDIHSRSRRSKYWHISPDLHDASPVRSAILTNHLSVEAVDTDHAHCVLCSRRSVPAEGIGFLSGLDPSGGLSPTCSAPVGVSKVHFEDSCAYAPIPVCVRVDEVVPAASPRPLWLEMERRNLLVEIGSWSSPASSSRTLWPFRARLAARGPPPAPEPTTMYSKPSRTSASSWWCAPAESGSCF